MLPVVKRVRSRPGSTVRICRDEQSVVVTVTVMEAGQERKARIQGMRGPLAAEAATWAVEGGVRSDTRYTGASGHGK